MVRYIDAYCIYCSIRQYIEMWIEIFGGGGVGMAILPCPTPLRPTWVFPTPQRGWGKILAPHHEERRAWI